jgi:hypothetical protein
MEKGKGPAVDLTALRSGGKSIQELTGTLGHVMLLVLIIMHVLLIYFILRTYPSQKCSQRLSRRFISCTLVRFSTGNSTMFGFLPCADFCKRISEKDKLRGVVSSDSELSDVPSDSEEAVLHHPFKVRDPSSLPNIIMNIRVR